MRISFQNPTKGPLITISFEDSDGVALAFVPAALSSAPADIAATSAASAGGSAVGIGLAGPLLVAAICSGDSSPRHRMPEVSAQPLRGVSRFASAVTPDGERVVSDASPTGPAPVDLPADPTESATTAVDAVQPIDWAALAVSDPIAFCKLAHQYIDSVKEEVLRRLERGDTLQDIGNWFQSEVQPKLNRLLDVLGNNRKTFKSLVQVFDVFAQRALLFRNYFENALEDGDKAALGKLCRMDTQVMANFMIRLRLMFMDTVDIHIQGLRDDHEIAPDQVAPLLQSLVGVIRDIVDRAESDERLGVVIRWDGTHLIVGTGKVADKNILLDFPVK